MDLIWGWAIAGVILVASCLIAHETKESIPRVVTAYAALTIIALLWQIVALLEELVKLGG